MVEIDTVLVADYFAHSNGIDQQCEGQAATTVAVRDTSKWQKCQLNNSGDIISSIF